MFLANLMLLDASSLQLSSEIIVEKWNLNVLIFALVF
ncbi:hypothetical protein BVRB_7g160570 [Beta vulgaris subsp. vulgaris]|nr:hypothetical protein BVRB_7g160570 [Beta vulgaris subsp. vulgaris]